MDNNSSKDDQELSNAYGRTDISFITHARHWNVDASADGQARETHPDEAPEAGSSSVPSVASKLESDLVSGHMMTNNSQL